MRLSWNEIRARAASFAKDWENEGYEKGQTQLFYRDFFDVFGVPVRKVASFEEPVKKLGNRKGYIDLFWKGVLLVEQKSSGKDLKKAKQQALNYFPGLKDFELPRYILLSDFQSFELYDLDEDDELHFSLSELPKNVEKFGFIIGVQKRTFTDQDPVNIQASELVGKLHDALRDSGYSGHDLEQLLVRIVFCLFADDTGIFEPRDLFQDLLETRTQIDGSDIGGWLGLLFQVLDTPEKKRQKNLDEDLTKFPYINGELFKGILRYPSFDTYMRETLLEACKFDWSGISPAIFGALFQSVMNADERRKQGAHYTTEKNILKVIKPLFLDELWSDFKRLKKRKDTHRRKLLQKFHEKLGSLTFFDPACGCGNFLIIAYRELRDLELHVIKELRAYEQVPGQRKLDATVLSLVDVDQFYGIEINEFPVRITEIAMWMMDHIMNNRLSLEFGQSFVRIPIQRAPHIHQTDALEIDWQQVIPSSECSYIFGNPPFVGSKYQSKYQREQVRKIANLGKSGGTLDYVTAWFIKAAQFAKTGDATIGFVATNSITQGEQVSQLWPIIFGQGFEITYAHRTFAWGSDARGVAHVHVVIVGLARLTQASKEKRLFTYDDLQGEPHESVHTVLSGYLFDGSILENPHIVVQEEYRPINGLPRLISGSQPIDNGNYIFSEEEKEEFLLKEPHAEKYLHQYVGAREYLHGHKRWILALHSAGPNDLRLMPQVIQKMRAVKKYRSQSKRRSTLAIAEYPERYNVNIIPEDPFLVIPKVSSHRREYVPIGWLEPPIIPSDLVFVMPKAKLYHFALLTSSMHMSWLRHIGGRLKSDYRYSIGLVYNTFPLPEGKLESLEPYTCAVLAARVEYSDNSLAELYDPDLMPPTLRRAHQALDRAVDRLYSRKKFSSDRERAEHLLGLYEKMYSPLLAIEKQKRKRRNR